MDADELRKVAMSNIDTITDCGFNKPIAKLELSDKVNIVQAVALHRVYCLHWVNLHSFVRVWPVWMLPRPFKTTQNCCSLFFV